MAKPEDVRDKLDPDFFEQREDDWPGHLPMLNKANEGAAWEFIDKIADERLTKYATTIYEDLKLITEDKENNNLTVNERNCILYRKNEKIILHFLKDSAKKAK